VNVHRTETMILSQRVGVVLGNCLGSAKVGALSTTRRGGHFFSVSCRNEVKNLVPSQKRHPADSSRPRHGAAAGKGGECWSSRTMSTRRTVYAKYSCLVNTKVGVAYNSPEGIAKAREFLPDVVLCDIGLPGMDGFAVARALKADESLRGAFLVALSGYALPRIYNGRGGGVRDASRETVEYRAARKILAELAPSEVCGGPPAGPTTKPQTDHDTAGEDAAQDIAVPRLSRKQG